MQRAADFLLDHPRITLTAWLVAVVVLLPQAALVNGRLSEPNYIVRGTESQRALALDQRAFGSNVELPILLSGPPRALAKAGPRIAAALDRLRNVTILSPFDASVPALRPSPSEAMLIAQVQTQPAEVLSNAGRLAAAVRAEVHPPLRASITGEAFIGKSLQDQTLAGTHRAEAIALPVLLFVLLLVFGTPIAAAIPAVFGIATVAAGFGVISLLALVLPLEATALSLASMMGLAIGVDYSLLLVARFREELGTETTPAAAKAAARRARATAGRTTAFAGGTLAIALVVALAVSPGTLILSSIAGVIVVACLSVLSAVLAVPAALVLVGPRINRATIWRRRGHGHRITSAVARLVLNHPALTALAVAAPLVALGLHAFSLTPRTPGVDLLPSSDPARVQYAGISRVMGPGWGATFRVNVAVGTGTLTDSRHIDELASLQRQIAAQPGVAAVIGPAALVPASREVHGLSGELAAFERSAARTGPQLDRLHRLVGSTTTLVGQLTSGLEQAGKAGEELSSSAGAAHTAASQLTGGLNQLASATAQLKDGLASAQSGAQQLASGSASAANGANRLLGATGSASSALAGAQPLIDGLDHELTSGASAVRALQSPAQLTETQLKAALAALESMTTGRQDPRYEAALLAVQEASALVTGLSPATGKPLSPKYPGLTRALSEIATSAGRAATSAGALAASTAKLQSGLTQLHDGERTLAGGLAQLQSGDSHESAALAQLQQQAAQSEPGIDRLASGEQQLSGGIAKLATAAGQLSSSLRSAPTRTAPVRGALGQSRSALAGARRLLSESAALQRLTRQSPGLFQSGDSLLAALDGAPSPVRREAASFVSIARGGQGARLFVVPRTGPTSAATARLYDRLKRITAAFARRTGTAAAVGGDAALVIDYARQVSGILPVLIITLAVVTWLALVVVARALILPLIAVALNLLTVSAAFGALVLLYQGSAPLGGPGYLDAVAVVGIFGIVFGLSIDYEVFLVSRMREEYARTGSTDAAIAGGLLQTAGVVTGAAAIMAGVFLAFASSSFVDIAEFGTGLTIAVVLDATLVRIVLLPALTRLCGDRAWWLPAWLERIIAPAHGAPGPNGGAPSPGNGAGPHSSAIATAYSASSPTR